MRGVGHELALGATDAERSSASSIALKLVAMLAISSSPLASILRARSRVRATCSAASVRRRSGVVVRTATIRPSRTASATPPIAARTKIVRSRCRMWSTSRSERPKATAPPPSNGKTNRNQ